MNEEEPLNQRYLLRFKMGVAVLILLAIPSVLHSQAAIDSLFNRPSDWVPDSLPVKAEFNHFTNHFSASDLVMLAWDGSDLDAPELEQTAAMFRPLCEATFDADQDQELQSELPRWVRREIDAIRQQCRTSTPFQWVRTGSETLARMTSAPANLSRRSSVARLQGSLVGPDGKQTALILSFNRDGLLHRRYLIPKIRALAGRLNKKSETEIAIVGGPFDGATVDSASIRSIRTFSPPSAILAAILCLICLRSIPLTGAIVAVAVIGEGLVLAAVYYTGAPMNAVLIVLPPLVFVLTVSAGIHLSNYYLDAAHEFPDLTRAQSAKRAMQAGVAPCCLATGTTVIGLGSLMLVRLEPVRIFGGVASLGVIITLALLFLILPGAMVLTKPRRKSEDDPETGPAGPRHFAGVWMRRRLAKPWPLITTFLLVALGLSFGLTQLQSSVNIPRMFLPDSDIRRQYAWFEEHLGPTVTGDLLLTFPPLTEQDDPLDRLEMVKQAHLVALRQEPVEGVLSPMTFVPSIPRQRSLGAAARRSVIKTLIRNPDSSLGKLGFIARDGESEVWRISIRMPHQKEGDYSDEIAKILTAVKEQLADSVVPAKITLTGHVTIVQQSQEILLRDLFRSFMTAFGIIALVMMLMLRSVIGGLIAMAPNLFPTVVLFGFMGLVRLPLDIGSVMSASVALGIAVDDTVHLLSRFGSRRARGLGQIRAAYGALAQCGWAMFQTTLVCGLSLMVYWLSDFVPTSRFSLFMFGLLSAALMGVVFLLPTLMSTPLGRWLSRTVGANAAATLYSDQSKIEAAAGFARGWFVKTLGCDDNRAI
ncbi:MAG: MMPL family transporter [Pirellulales bacterium]|nr:MMPL family transporter [Pirellulales bacterium]